MALLPLLVRKGTIYSFRLKKATVMLKKFAMESFNSNPDLVILVGNFVRDFDRNFHRDFNRDSNWNLRQNLLGVLSF